MTLLDKANRLTPIACRLLARKNSGHTAMTYEDISQRSGMSVSTVKSILKRSSWAGIAIDKVVRLAAACGVDHLKATKEIYFLKHRKWEHVTKARNVRQRQMFRRILNGSGDAHQG